MKVSFEYNKEKDIWCLLNKGKSSSNSSTPTKVYEQFITQYGDNLTSGNASLFIDGYVSQNNVDILSKIDLYQKDWELISVEYQQRAEAIFGVILPKDVVAYLTINNRCPYDIENNYFYVSTANFSVRKTVMHELWHFYTWYGLGAEEMKKLGAQTYNDFKEALTVLLNVECTDLLPDGAEDMGYPQHKELREKIVRFWQKDKNIRNLWKYLTT